MCLFDVVWMMCVVEWDVFDWCVKIDDDDGVCVWEWLSGVCVVCDIVCDVFVCDVFVRVSIVLMGVCGEVWGFIRSSRRFD